MPNYIEQSAKTIDEAIAAACEALGRDRDSVSVEVLQTPQKGFFGIKSQPAVVRVSYESDRGQRAVTFLRSVLEKLGVSPEIELSLVEEQIQIVLSGCDMGVVIGRRGETLDALQYLCALVANKGEEDYQKVMLDTENYRNKRKETLERLAKKMAGKALKYRRNISLEPMNPYERRIIHATLQGMDDVETHSVGSEPHRKVIINYTGPNKAADRPNREGGRPQGSGSRPQGGGNRPPRREGGGGGRPPRREGGGERRGPRQTEMQDSPVSQIPSRPPRSDKDLFMD